MDCAATKGVTIKGEHKAFEVGKLRRKGTLSLRAG